MTTPATLVHFRFDEPDATIPPSDAMGSVGDLTSDADVAVVPALTGFGRWLDDNVGMRAQDITPGASLTTRDCTVQVIIAAPYGGTDEGTVVCRGTGDSASEYVAYALEVYTADGDSSARAMGVRWWWHDTAGHQKLQIGADFIPPSMPGYPYAAGFFLLTATRRWVSATRVELAYYVGGELLGEIVSVDGDIGGGTTGTFCVGAYRNGGVDASLLEAIVDELRVTNYVMSQEEIAATWDRLALHQPRGYRAMRDLMQPGAPVSDDPSSRFQKLYRLAGYALGYAMAQVENARLNILPDRAFGATLEEWELILREPARAADSIRARRDRLVAHFRQRAGVSVPGVRATLTKLLALAKSQIQVLSFSPTIMDSTLPTGALPSLWWFREPAQWTRSGAALIVSFAGTDDVRWDASTSGLHAALLAVESLKGTVFQTKRSGGGGLPVNAELGIVAWDMAGANYLFFGVENNAGTYRLVYQVVTGGVAAAKVIVATTGDVPVWYRFRFAVAGAATTVTIEYSLTSPTTGFVAAVSNLPCASTYGWVGLHCRTSSATLGGAIVDVYSDTRLRVPKSTRAFNWYVYRDPTLPGVPDIGGATAALRRLKHAHTKAAVITNKQLLCDDPSNGCDLGPMGGY